MAKAKVVNIHQPSPKVLACRRNGRLGGLARAKNKTSEQMKAWSSKGGKATVDRYGSDLMKFINKRTRTVGRYRKLRVPLRTKVA